jgi:hypothetical protein
MLQLLAKAIISGAIVAAASEIARRSPGLGALVGALPLVSLLVIVLLWHETGDAGRIADYAVATFWLVLPTLPMFLLLAWLLRKDVAFWPALSVSAAVTIVLYVVTARIVARLGIDI